MINGRYNQYGEGTNLLSMMSKVGMGRCACGILLGIVGLTVAIYAGLGTVGWKSIRKHINYEDKYYQALNIADKNRDADLSIEETQSFFKELGVTKLPNQGDRDVRPAYNSLCDYIEKDKR